MPDPSLDLQSDNPVLGTRSPALLKTVVEAGLVLDPRTGTRLVGFEVISVALLSTSRLLISLAIESPWEFDYSAGRDLFLLVGNEGACPAFGRYQIKIIDPGTRHLEIVAALGPDGPAARWAASVVPGEPVAAIGPGRMKMVRASSL
jgi:hypothetical protein